MDNICKAPIDCECANCNPEDDEYMEFPESGIFEIIPDTVRSPQPTWFKNENSPI